MEPSGRTLVIECATEACSVALFDGDALVDARHETIGRGHAERLVPLIAQLPDRGRASSIRVSLGPGSFTGIRIGLAAARALGVAWQASVRGYPTLALVAAVARGEVGAGPVTVCMTGGHGEWFVQDFAADGMPQGPLASLTPDRAAIRPVHPVLAGSQAGALASMVAAEVRPVPVLPDAREAPGLPEALLSNALAPLYGRAPDAKPAAVRP